MDILQKRSREFIQDFKVAKFLLCTIWRWPKADCQHKLLRLARKWRDSCGLSRISISVASLFSEYILVFGSYDDDNDYPVIYGILSSHVNMQFLCIPQRSMAGRVATYFSDKWQNLDNLWYSFFSCKYAISVHSPTVHGRESSNIFLWWWRWSLPVHSLIRSITIFNK